MSQSLDQKRASYAWECVRNVTGDYVNLAKAAPSLIMANGLMQTLAFFKSKGKDHHEKVLQHILGWLGKPEAGCSFLRSNGPSATFDTAMPALAGASSEQYLRATQEALAILKWIRHLAAAAQRTQGGDRK